MRKWFGAFVVVVSALATACGEGSGTSSDDSALTGRSPFDTGAAGAGAAPSNGPGAGTAAGSADGTSGLGDSTVGAGAGDDLAGDMAAGAIGPQGGADGNPAAIDPGVAGTADGSGAAAVDEGGADDGAPAAGGDAEPTPADGFDNGGNHFIRGPNPTIDSATAEGPYMVQSYSSGFAIGPDFPGGTIWYPTDAQAPFGDGVTGMSPSCSITRTNGTISRVDIVVVVGPIA